MKKLLLWDIDSTLIDSGGAGERSLICALENTFGVSDPLRWLDYSGRTDFWIARTILEHHFGKTSQVMMQQYLDAYLQALDERMDNPHAHVIPGIRDTVARAATTPGVVQGLLTGNLKRGAEIKLRHLGLWDFFSFGAFADDAEDRNELGPIAQHRAESHTGAAFLPGDIVVIGDTPRDIACGKAIGSQTVAVATGRFSAEILAKHEPTTVLTSFSQPESFWALLH